MPLRTYIWLHRDALASGALFLVLFYAAVYLVIDEQFGAAGAFLACAIAAAVLWFVCTRAADVRLAELLDEQLRQQLEAKGVDVAEGHGSKFSPPEPLNATQQDGEAL